MKKYATFSLVAPVGYYEGFASGSFAVACILAVIMIDDALRLRMYMGDQERSLNILLEKLPADEKEFPRLKKRVEHRVNEVIVGGIFGFVVTLTLAMIL